MQSLQNIIEDANIPGLQLTYINNGKEVNYVVVAGDKYGGKPNTTVRSRAAKRWPAGGAVYTLFTGSGQDENFVRGKMKLLLLKYKGLSDENAIIAANL